jgi:spermidine synthase
MMAFLLFNPAPARILMIGLGGGSLAKFCYHTLPEADITVVEISPDVIALRSEFVIPDDDHRFRVVRQDGAEFMAHCDMQFDVILVDAFDPDGIALSLPSLNFYSHAYKRLTPQGVLVMNLCGDDERYPPNLSSLMTAFKTRPIVVTVKGSNNKLAFSFKQRVVLSMSAEMIKRATELKSLFKLQFPRYLRRLCQAQQL